jgi:hypothetical protein
VQAPIHLNAKNLPTVPLLINHQVHIHSTEANALRVVMPPRHVFVCSENCTLEVDRVVVSLPTIASMNGDASPTGGVITGFMTEVRETPQPPLSMLPPSSLRATCASRLGGDAARERRRRAPWHRAHWRFVGGDAP